MSGRARRALPGFLPRALAGLWAVLLVLAGTSGTAGATSGPLLPGPSAVTPASPAATPSGPFGTASQPTSAAAPQVLTAHTAPGRPRADARTAPDRPVARQTATAHIQAVLPHPRFPGLPGALPSASPAPRHSPFGYGETVGPRQERAPPWARYSPRSPRGPPFVRSS
ncbi:hypothetical protein [Streptomyces monomycini]|uniref:hypothetical protein n=1 Tax=Streptomyces monomycini TaxID=371720 RepID=UPI0004AA744E|nr:hypothetical protein [Streptomyces monomycini]